MSARLDAERIGPQSALTPRHVLSRRWITPSRGTVTAMIRTAQLRLAAPFKSAAPVRALHP